MLNINHNLNADITGIDSLPAFNLKIKNKEKVETFMTSEFLQRGILGFRQFKSSIAHKENDFNLYEEVLEEVVTNIIDVDFNVDYKLKSRYNSFSRLTQE